MRTYLIYNRLCVICLFSFIVFFEGSVALADPGAIGIDGVDVVPPSPLVGEPISITTYGWNGYVADFSFFGSNFGIYGNDIFLNTYFIDTTPGMGLPIAIEWEDTQNIGSLAAGTYNVTSLSWEIIGYGGPTYVSDAFTTSFIVTPEPATVFLLGLGGLALLRKRNS